MKVITSQDFLDDEIVERKIEELESSGAARIILPVVDAGMTNEDGEELFILVDGHHRRAAAEELGLDVDYEIVDNETDAKTPEEMFIAYAMGGDWYYVDNGYFVF